MNYKSLYTQLENSEFNSWLSSLPGQIDAALQHGDLASWMQILDQFPNVKPSLLELSMDAIRIGLEKDCSLDIHKTIERGLHKLHPWRKGPYNIFGIHIDSEWRSDFKWRRLANEIGPLKGKIVLDVGCGNGYHGWRMLGAKAKIVIGIDPFLLSVVQFWAVRKYTGMLSFYVLPLGIEQLPANLHAFDTIFSMGVLHHRRSPIDHLMELREALRPGGELVLETLVIEGDNSSVVVPEGRYAKMRNVWFMPTPLTLESWLKRCKYKNIRIIDITKTTTEEQRSTEWMTYESLDDFLDKDNPDLTIEGLPAPRRAIFIAEAP